MLVLGVGRLMAHHPKRRQAQQLIAFAVIIQLCLFCGNHVIDRMVDCRSGATGAIVASMRTHKELIKELKRRGCHVVHSKSHLKVLRPNGSYAMTMAHSPSDRSATESAVRLAYRLGLLEKPC